MGGEKACHACGKPLTRKRYPNGTLETPHHYNRRKYCNPTCHTNHRRTASRAKHECEHCGAPLKRRDNENWARYVTRRFCDKRCHGAARSLAARENPTPRKPRVRPRTPAWQRAARPTEPRNLPDPRPKPTEATARMVTLGKPCPRHPGEKVGWYGCPACNAGAAWRAGERSVTARPSIEGGR